MIIIINTLNLTKVVVNIIMRHYNFSGLIVINQGLLFTPKFGILFYYFLKIKQKFLITFNFQINNQIIKQINIMQGYFSVFVNYK